MDSPRHTDPAAPDLQVASRRKPAGHRGVTIAEVAEYAGVSVPTVSKVLNGRANVSPHTRRRVEEALRDNGYRRRRRTSERSNLVEVVFHRLEGEWAMEVIRGIQQVARERRLSVVLSEALDARTPGPGWMEDLLAHRPLGVISVGTELSPVLYEALAAHTIPLVIVDAAGEPVQDTPSVGAANWSGGYTATRHLLELGHRRIAAVSGPLNVLCARARLDGYRAAMDAEGMSTDGLVRHGEFLVEDGHAQGADLLSLPQPPTGIVTGNDLQALGVYHAAMERGLRVPRDLSVVGFDDHPVAGWASPQLTTVRQPVLEMAVDATEMLVRLANGDPPRDTRVELATHLIVRQSTAAPPA